MTATAPPAYRYTPVPHDQLEALDDLLCGRCVTILDQLARDRTRYTWVGIRRGRRGAFIHAVSTWNHRSVCGNHHDVRTTR